MEKTLSAIRQTARQILKDEFVSGTAYDFKDDELDIHINEARVEISQRRPYEVKETLYASNKSGAATATTASHLVDTTNSQFVAGDVGKTVYNSTDKTEALVTARTSASDITLDTDIMASGENYTIYCAGGANPRDVSVAEITDLIEVEKAEYPTRRWPRNFRDCSVFGSVATLDVDSAPDDGDEIFLYCYKVHSLTESTSTLSPQLEKVLVEGVVAKAAQAWCAEQMRKDIVPGSVKLHQNWADRQFIIYQNSLNSITKTRVWEFYSPG